MVNAKKYHKVGLAVIFGTVNKKGPQGADLDVQNAKKTFENLNYAHWVIKNPTRKIMETVIKIVSEFNYYSIELKSIVLYYTGHGGSVFNNPYLLLPSENDKFERFYVNQEVVPPFQPSNPTCHLDNRIRIFLFDSCLKEDAYAFETPPKITPPPLNPCQPFYQPDTDYTIIAFAAYYGDVSRGDFSTGGVWTFALLANINEHATSMTVMDILSKTNNDVIFNPMYAGQAPFFIVCCGESCYFVEC